MVQEKIIVQVRKNKSNNQKILTIPKDSKINEGDYVKIIKINMNAVGQ